MQTQCRLPYLRMLGSGATRVSVPQESVTCSAEIMEIMVESEQFAPFA
jgi:hypothetical protein